MNFFFRKDIQKEQLDRNLVRLYFEMKLNKSRYDELYEKLVRLSIEYTIQNNNTNIHLINAIQYVEFACHMGGMECPRAIFAATIELRKVLTVEQIFDFWDEKYSGEEDEYLENKDDSSDDEYDSSNFDEDEDDKDKDDKDMDEDDKDMDEDDKDMDEDDKDDEDDEDEDEDDEDEDDDDDEDEDNKDEYDDNISSNLLTPINVESNLY